MNKNELHREAIGLILSNDPRNKKRIREINSLVGIDNDADWGRLVEVIRNKIDPVELIGSIIPVNNRGKAVCPFHEDTLPSLSIDKNRRIWKCFSCPNTNGGDIIKFVELYYKTTWFEAMKSICEKYEIDWEEIIN